MESLLSKELLDNPRTLRIEEIVGNSLKTNDYELFDEYYTVNKSEYLDTILNKNLGPNSYFLRYGGVTMEMYFAMFVPKSGENKAMITIAYAKYDYGWKIFKLTLDTYTINGKTGPELNQQAIKELSKNYLVKAKNTLDLAVTGINPNPFWHYFNETEIFKADDSVTALVKQKIKYPIVLNTINTKPQIFGVFTKTSTKGSFPLVYYLSKIKVSDTKGIEQEHQNIKKVIGQIIPGIDKDGPYLYYNVFNQLPTAKKTVERYEIEDKLK
jgi:hypothetical protein